MDIVFVYYSHLGTNSGMHIRHLANRLTSLGAHCTVCVPAASDAMEEAGSVLFDLMTLAELRRSKASRSVDILHAWTPREATRTMTEELAAVYMCPYIVHLEDNEEFLLKSALGPALARLGRMSRAELDKLVPPHMSHPMRYREFLDGALGFSMIMDTLHEFCPPDREHAVIWAGYDESLPWSRPADSDLRAALHIPPEDHVIAYTGNVHSANREEVFSLYLAAKLLSRRGIKTWLLRTGTDYVQVIGPELDELKDACIEFGRVPREMLPSILSIADALVQPGKADAFNAYRFPSKLPEFLATGKPVLLPASNIGRFMKDGEECILLQHGSALEIAQKLEILFEDPDLSTRIGAAGRQFAERNLTWQKSAEKLLEFYERLLAPRTITGSTSRGAGTLH